MEIQQAMRGPITKLAAEVLVRAFPEHAEIKPRPYDEIVKDILSTVYKQSLAMTMGLNFEDPPDDYEPDQEWKDFDLARNMLPLELDFSSYENLVAQFKDIDPEDLKISLWKFIEGNDELTFGLGDDGTDEAEMEKDVIAYIIEDIREAHCLANVLFPTFITMFWAHYEYMDQSRPCMWIPDKLEAELVAAFAKESPHFSCARAWVLSHI